MRKILPLMLLCCFAMTAATLKRTIIPDPRPIDIELVVDSATILADDYAEAMANKPEMVKSRMNALKRFYAPYSSNKTVGDSICDVIFNMYVDNIERGNIGRANAIKECFTEIADKDNEHYGPLYATELELAKERFDTTAVAHYIPLLSEYSQRLGYDHDEAISTASRYLNSIRNRRPLRDALPGIWVSEDIVGINGYDGVYWKEDWDLYYGQVILQIRDATNPIYPNYNFNALRPDSITGLSIVRWSGKRENGLGSDQFDGIIDKWEGCAHNIEWEDTTRIPEASKNWANNLWNAPTFRYMQADDQAYALYIYDGDEKLKRNNAEVGAIIRRSAQQVQATTAGELSRRKYSTGDRLAGNLTAGAVGAVANGLADALMVSTDRIQSVEITLRMINPNCLEADILSQKIISKSNKTSVTPYVVNRKVKYYRWEPNDSVFFMGTHLDNCSKDNYSGLAGMYSLYNLSKDELNALKDRKNQFEKAYQIWVRRNIKEYKARLKGLDKKSDEYKKRKQEYDSYKNGKSGIKAWQKWNAESLAKLKAKSDNYKP